MTDNKDYVNVRPLKKEDVFKLDICEIPVALDYNAFLGALAWAKKALINYVDKENKRKFTKVLYIAFEQIQEKEVLK